MNRRLLSTVLALLLLLTLATTAAPPALAQSPVARPHPDGSHLQAPDGRLLFALGYNYEGPADRAWQMWVRFDAGLIANDLARAKGGGANTVRIFVQDPLPAEIMAGDFSKLDTVIQAAASQGLFILLTFSDYAQRDLAAVAEVDRRIAARYRGNPTILAYDLRNEPQFLTLASATYPSGTDVPLQRPDLVATYGERVARADIPGWRTSGDGRVLPPSWNDDQAYAYANNLAYFRDFLSAAENWVVSGSGRTITDYPASPEAQPWQPLWAALDGTLASWINVQRDQIRSVDPEHMLTVGWSNLLLARLPTNSALLDFVSLHRFPKPGTASVAQTLQLGAALRQAHPGRPLMFEEVGFSTAEIDPEGAATLEMAQLLRAYSEGFAGLLKWMLTDLPPVGDPREDNFGALTVDGNPKPTYHAFGAFGTYITASAASPGGTLNTFDRAEGPAYSFSTRDAHYLAGSDASDGGLSFRLLASGQVLLRKRGALYLLATQPGDVTLDLRTLMPVWTGTGVTVEQRSGEGWAPVQANSASDGLHFSVQPTTPYRITLPRHTDAAAPQPDCTFFSETSHNLCGSFRAYWQAHGGLAIFGYPISESFAETSQQDGKSYTVQYFERNRFEYHPEQAGTPYEVLLGLLGNDLTANRKSEPPFQPVTSTAGGRDLYTETGHSLGGPFRAYWESHGGLAVFGYPTSEEFAEVNPADGNVYTVQYFERNRFEYHPEQAGTPYTVLLGLLGNQTVDGNGWR